MILIIGVLVSAYMVYDIIRRGAVFYGIVIGLVLFLCIAILVSASFVYGGQ
jgi:hypothetical protein